MSKLKIKRWDPQTMKTTSTILLVGRRGAGKSTLMTDLAWHFAQRDCFDLALGMSPTDESSESLGSFLPKTLIYDSFREDKIAALMASQKAAWKRGHGPHVVLFLDDCAYDKSCFRSTTMRELFMNGRHRRICLVFAVQYLMDMPPDIRSNIDVVIAARDPIHSSREKLWKCFFGLFRTIEEFNLTFSACTANYETLVMHGNTGSQSNDIEDCIFWHKADPNRPKFRLGKEVYWRMDDRYYRDREEELEDEKKAVAELARRKEIRQQPVADILKADDAGRTIVPRY